MSRHNRRRSRGGRKHASPSQAGMVSPDLLSIAEEQPFFQITTDYSRNTSPTPEIAGRMPFVPDNMPLPRSRAPSARVWHNRYAAWQTRLQLEAQKTKDAERLRVFGGAFDCSGSGLNDYGCDVSDDEAEDLEEKMINYFQGLDWLN